MGYESIYTKMTRGLACGDVGVSQVDEAGTVSGRSLRS